MHRLALFVTLSLTAWSQASPDTPAILRAVEKRYNSTTTLQANFTVTLKERGRPHLPEHGIVYLSKGSPSRTRWDYATPAGNFFLSDGKFVYDYDKQKNEVARYPFKESEDLRIPLAFLLGKLDFNKDFERFAAAREGANTVVAMTPRNKRVGFKEITMTVAPDAAVLRVLVTDQPGTSVMEYVLEAEQRNGKLDGALFKFTPPQGARVVDLNQ
jgi:outer membrane lipoprotein carrier protein